MKCRYCRGKVLGTEPLRSTCWECVVTFRWIAEAHAEDNAQQYRYSRIPPDGHAERVERYARIVAAGGKLFE